MRMAPMQKITLLDLYCGLGGFSLGFEMTEAFTVLGGVDHDKWALKTFNSYHASCSGLLTKPQDMSVLSPQAVLDALGQRPDMIVGGPPCQGFSAAGKRLESYLDDARNKQVFEYLRFVREIEPKAFLMENVSGIRTTGQKKSNELLDHLIREYSSLGYRITWKVLNAAHYRVPQRRLRFIMVGVRDGGSGFTFPDPPCGNTIDLFRHKEMFCTACDALGDLPSPTNAEPQPYEMEALSPLQVYLREGSEAIFNHLVTNHSRDTVEKLRAQKIGTRLYDWNHSWYRLDPRSPSPTIKMNNRAPAVHYAEPRLISPRECARLQTIPDRIVLAGNKTQQLTQVGNAVPSIMAAHIASAIATQFFNVAPPVRWDALNNPLAGNSVKDAHKLERGNALDQYLKRAKSQALS